MLRIVLVGLAAMVGASGTANESGWELLVTSVADPTPRTCFQTPGLAKWVQGTYLVSGPAKWELGEYKMNGIFDGFGMLNRFELRNSEVCFTSVWLDTMYQNVSNEKQCVDGFLFEDTTPGRPMKCYSGGAQVGGDNNWVNAISFGGEILLLSDTALMMRFDKDTLAQPGRKAWTDDKKGTSGNPDWARSMHMVATGSAHPVRRPGTNTWVAILSQMGIPVLEKSYIDFYTWDADAVGPQARTKLGSSGPLKAAGYMHSYGVTPNYVVMPITQTFGAGAKGCKSPLDMLCSIGGLWQGIHVIDNEGRTTVFDSEPFMHVHIVNAFENSTGIVLDVGAYQSAPFSRTGALDIEMFLNKSQRNENPARAVMRRLHMHTSGPLAGNTTLKDFDKIPNSHSDFFRINDAYIGLPYCYYYATEWWHDSKNYANMAIVKHDMCSDTKTYWSRDDVYVGEPYFIQTPGGKEDDGLLVFVALDGQQRRSIFVTLDAKTLKEVPNTDVTLPGHIPFTAHGDFFFDDETLLV